MPERDPSEMSEEELRRHFLYKGTDFFTWNSGKNTPNILLGLSGRLETLQARAAEATESVNSLRETLREASTSSDKLSHALNRLTLALVIVGAIGLLVQAVYVSFTIWQYVHK